MIRKAQAHWSGNLKSGNGHLSTESKVLENTNYSFHTRFESGQGTNPEELLAAAHAGCFTMAISAALTQAGKEAIELDTEAILDLDLMKLTINGIHLKISGKVNNITKEEFEAIVKNAEVNCLISKSLSIPITSEIISFN